MYWTRTYLVALILLISAAFLLAVVLGTEPVRSATEVNPETVRDSIKADVDSLDLNLGEMSQKIAAIAQSTARQLEGMSPPNSTGVDAAVKLECDVWWDRTTVELPYVEWGTTTLAKLDMPKFRKRREEWKIDVPSTRVEIRTIGYYPKCRGLKCRMAPIRTKIPVPYMKRIELKFDIPELYFEYEEIKMDLPKVYTRDAKLDVPKFKCSQLEAEFSEYEDQIRNVTDKSEAAIQQVKSEYAVQVETQLRQKIEPPFEQAMSELEEVYLKADSSFATAFADIDGHIATARTHGREAPLLQVREDMERERAEVLGSIRARQQQLKEEKEQIFLQIRNDMMGN